MKLIKLITFLIIKLIFLSNYCLANSINDKKFDKFILNFSKNKLKNSFDKNIVEQFKNNTKFIKRVIELDRSQPEFKLTMDEYLKKVVTNSRITKARLKFNKNSDILKKIENKFNVQARFIVALWGIETDFGRYTGSFPVISSLATLVYDGRRKSYFEKELINALKIIQQGHITINDMKGSWAGAMGQCQFMPSSFLRYAVDYNKDNKKDIWMTKSDVFASAANYLKNVGWNYNQTWGRKIYFNNIDGTNNPKELLKKFNKTQTLKEWKNIGLMNIDKSPLPDSDIKARLIIPKSYKNYGYLVYNNFESLLNWNRSNYFAVAVGILSDHMR